MRGNLIGAAKKGDVGKVRALIEAGREIDGSDARGKSALYHAAEKGHAEVVRVLIEHGASQGGVGDGWAPLGIAAFGGRVEVVRVLLEAGAAPSPAIMDAATRKGHVDVLEALLDAGADPNGEDEGDAPALFTGNATTARLLLARGADPNHRTRDGRIAFGWYAQMGTPEGALVLIENGLDMKITDAKRHGMNPLQLAASFGAYEPARALLDRGADVSIRDDRGYTVFDIALDGAFKKNWKHWSQRQIRNCRRLLDDLRAGGRMPVRQRAKLALMEGDLEVLRGCLDEGLDVDARLADWSRLLALDGWERMGALIVDAAGRSIAEEGAIGPTLLMWASALGRIEVVRLLLEHGADPELLDEDDHRARDFARYRGHDAVFEVLDGA